MKRFDLLRSPLFLIALAALVLNDLVLKAVFHNWLTGKLSDFAGLAAFALFCCALWPERRWVIAAAVGAAFSYWKSPYSQGLIDLSNGLLPLHIARTVDYTDLVALPVIWICCALAPRLRLLRMRQFQVWLIAGVSLVAFTGTSTPSDYTIRQAAELGPVRGHSAAGTEADLQRLLDSIADGHRMRCTICDPLSNGRLYANNGDDWRSQINLYAGYDSARSELIYEIRKPYPKDSPAAKEGTALQTELTDALRSSYPDVKVSNAERPHETHMQIGVYKKDDRIPRTDPANQDDFRSALEVIHEAVTDDGLKLESDTLYGAGRLFGARPTDRDLTVSAHISDWPLVMVDIWCYSGSCRERQYVLANTLERRLKETFGAKRAKIRWTANPPPVPAKQRREGQ